MIQRLKLKKYFRLKKKIFDYYRIKFLESQMYLISPENFKGQKNYVTYSFVLFVTMKLKFVKKITRSLLIFYIAKLQPQRLVLMLFYR
jgi:hypothetical protein